jgi:hypothetical protein
VVRRKPRCAGHDAAARLARVVDAVAAAGDLYAARQYAVQGLVVAAAQKSADQGGAFVRAFREPVLDPTPLAPADAELLAQVRARRRDL